LGSRVIAPYILNFVIRYRRRVKFTPQPLYLRGKNLEGWNDPLAGGEKKKKYFPYEELHTAYISIANGGVNSVSKYLKYDLHMHVAVLEFRKYRQWNKFKFLVVNKWHTDWTHEVF